MRLTPVSRIERYMNCVLKVFETEGKGNPLIERKRGCKESVYLPHCIWEGFLWNMGLSRQRQ